jgi:hypothetical protein
LVAITMIRYDIIAGLFAPVELLVTENEDGAGATMTYVRPSSLMVIEEIHRCSLPPRRLDQKFEALVTRAADASPSPAAQCSPIARQRQKSNAGIDVQLAQGGFLLEAVTHKERIRGGA